MSHHPSRRRERALAWATAGLTLAGAFLAPPAFAGSTSGSLPNGAALGVSVDAPLTGDTFLAPAGQSTIDVPLRGTASVATGVPNATWIYVIDVSGSTAADCAAGTILDCEKTAVVGLNDLLVTAGSALEAGTAIFAGTGAALDSSSAPGFQRLVTPTNPDIDGAIASITFGHAGQFTPVSVSGGTNYTAGLEAASTIAQAATGGSDINVVFLSDGLSNLGGAGFSAALAHLAGEATIHPFAVGPEANCAAGSQGTLAAMAEASGTLCHDVPNPANLPDVIKNVTATTLSSVAVTLDGAPVAASVVPTVPTSGPASVAWTAQGTDLAPGSHQVCATASGVGPSSNPAATGSVTRCETFDVYAFALAPPTATNELGVDDTHTVTATLSGPSGKLAGHGVAFAVSGVNAGESGTCAPASCTTDAAGRVTFTYDVPKEPASLGDDTIRATVTVGAESVALTVAKSWVDTTPPVARCVPTTNPGGHIPRAPGNGGQGQNQDGFYRLVATDDVWPTTALDLTVSDAATGTEFGPFAVDTDVKWTQANGAAPSQKPGSGDVEWRLKGQGDMVLVAVDGSGNRSAPVTCLVPNPPK